MKTWILVQLVGFIAVAGYQFGFYRGKLVASAAEKARINDVLTRSRKHEQPSIRHGTGTFPQRSVVLTDFLNTHPNGKAFTLTAFQCDASDACEFTARYAGDNDGFLRLIHDLQQQDWWHFYESKRRAVSGDGIATIEVTFSTRKTLSSQKLGQAS